MLYLLIFVALNHLAAVTAKCSFLGERYPSGSNTNTYEAMKFLTDTERRSSDILHRLSKIYWVYESDLSKLNRVIMMNTMQESSELFLETWKNATSFACKNFKDENELVYKWFKAYSFIGSDVLPEKERNEMDEISTDMEDIYSKAKLCRFSSLSDDPCDLSLEPGFEDTGEFERDAYESDTFVEEIEELWQTLKPLYEQLHAYVRRKLIQYYPHVDIKEDGPIPAHILGNMWSESWNNIFDIVKPYPNKTYVNLLKMELKKKMTPLDMFKTAEDFFTSLGLPEMTPEFWHYSIIEKPKNREMVCHASAWDLGDGKDYRIKMCTRVNMEDLIVVHHEMGYIIYYMHYSHQLHAFQSGANPCKIDTLSLQNVYKDEIEEDYENDISALMDMALDKIAFIPFGYLVDAWRWKVYDGSISSDELNSQWWNFWLKYQGICPPVRRTEDNFDPGAKYHVATNSDYIGDMLSLGSSVHWKEAMRVITRGKTSKMDAGSILEYFAPLMEWLKEQNKDEFIGWRSNDPTA
ncbi:Angiotensin-converting enzyme like protein [Argiope bruennichi]|uniref:Angiotensin-converting enzyme n=1 Tax=Argiope bruennichi TaxID=94029 RepID=A0A8T0FVJ4_ARGBR|nr:Angiotensin-converting enzyme like protein [Argiope bruennichi]